MLVKSVSSNATRYTYEEASKEAQKLGIVSSNQYLEFAKQDPRLPLNPSAAYRNKGWNGWLAFLRIKSFTYDEAVLRLKELGIADQKTYYSFDGDIRFPPHPDSFYSNKGWKSWASFFGNVNRSATNRHIFHSYLETISKIRQCGITNHHRYRQLCQADVLLPTNPEATYKDKGWVSWAVFWGKITRN